MLISRLIGAVLIYIGLSGVAVGVLALPSAFSKWHAYEAFMAQAAVNRIDAPEFVTARTVVGRAVSERPHDSELLTMWANLELAQAVQVEDSAVAMRHRANARRGALATLLLTPTDPYAWYQRASAEEVPGFASPQSMAAFRQSILYGRAEGTLALFRLTYCLAHHAQLPLDLIDECRAQARMARAHLPWTPFVAPFPPEDRAFLERLADPAAPAL